MKKILISLILLSNITHALTIDDLIQPKELMGRCANSDIIEERKNNTTKKEDKITQQETNSNPITETKTAVESFADLSLKKIANDINLELDIETAKINSDLSILWAAMCERSETIKYTIYKLSNPDEDKPNDTMLKKIIKPIANFSSLAGASFSADPYLATGALIGGGLVNAIMKDDKELNYRFSKVSDSDMVLLIRKIDNLQKKILDLYIDYKTKEHLVVLTKENLEKKEQLYNQTQNLSKEELTIISTQYNNAKVKAQRAEDEFMIARSILENLVGIEAVKKIEES